MMKRCWIQGDNLFDILNYCLFSFILFIMIYPLYWVVIASISDPSLVTIGRIWMYPQGINFMGFKTIFNYKQIWLGYTNSIIYMILGTSINVIITLAAGYALSRRDLVGRNFFMGMIVVTMFFSGGLIPTYLVVKGIGIENTMWAMVLPNAVNAFLLILARTFFTATIPKELLESAMMDGCRNFRFFRSIALPLSMPIIAVMTIFSAVGHWNSYLPSLLYLRDQEMYPLQLVLRNILILEASDASIIDPLGNRNLDEKRKIAEQIKYGVILVSTLPVLVLYPFLQRFFIKGVMVGSIKG